jgi:hypothetical protein
MEMTDDYSDHYMNNDRTLLFKSVSSMVPDNPKNSTTQLNSLGFFMHKKNQLWFSSQVDILVLLERV